MEQITKPIFHSQNKKPVQIKRAIVSLSISVPVFDLDYEMDLYHEWKESFRPLSIRDALAVFPEAKESIKHRIQVLKDNLVEEKDKNNNIVELMENIVKPKYYAIYIEIAHEVYLCAERQINNEISVLSNAFKKPTKNTTIKDEDIFRAKQFPITELLSFNKMNKALCLWHSERTPSLHYYKKTNSVKCFSCGKYGDAIDIYREQHNVSFIKAVQSLL